MYYCSSTQEHWNGFMLQGESLCNVWCQLGGNNMQEGDFVDMHNLNFSSYNIQWLYSSLAISQNTQSAKVTILLLWEN